MRPVLRKTPMSFPKNEFPNVSDRTRDLSVSIKHRFDMPWDDAIAVANILDDMFNGRKEVDDDTLDKDLRALFYDLQAKDLLRTRREEYNSSNGKTLRAFYWRINEEEVSRVKQVASRSNRAKESAKTGGDVYDNLPEEAWARTAA